MTKSKIRWIASAAVVVWAIAAHAQGDDPRRLAFYTALTNDFIVSTNGTTKPIDLIRMVDEKWIDSAAGNQATQPYKRFQVPIYPSLPDQDPQDMFQLRPDEAVVYLGPTPPPCDYFSFTPFLFLRLTNSVSEKGDWLLASIRDPLNNALIQTEAGTGQPFVAGQTLQEDQRRFPGTAHGNIVGQQERRRNHDVEHAGLSVFFPGRTTDE